MGSGTSRRALQELVEGLHTRIGAEIRRLGVDQERPPPGRGQLSSSDSTLARRGTVSDEDLGARVLSARTGSRRSSTIRLRPTSTAPMPHRAPEGQAPLGVCWPTAPRPRSPALDPRTNQPRIGRWHRPARGNVAKPMRRPRWTMKAWLVPPAPPARSATLAQRPHPVLVDLGGECPLTSSVDTSKAPPGPREHCLDLDARRHSRSLLARFS